MADDGWKFDPALTPPGADYAVGFDLRIDQAATASAPLIENPRFSYYDSKQDLTGYEAGVALRRTQQGRMYLIMLSAAWQEVLLWSSCGGVLQVRPASLVQGQTYHVQASASGQHIQVRIGDQPVPIIDYWDTVAPIPTGEAAVGKRDGSATFSSVAISALSAPSAVSGAAPPHKADLSLRTWQGARWGFDGDEPIFALGKDTTAYQVKLVPGYAAQLYVPWYFHDFASADYANVLRDAQVSQTGEHLVLSVSAGSTDATVPYSSRTTVTVTYDATRNAYQYDHLSELVVPPGAPLSVVAPLEFADAGFHNGVPPASPQGTWQWPRAFSWSVYQTLDGALHKQPHNHANWYPGYATLAWNQAGMGFLKPDGGAWSLYGDPVSNPVFQMMEGPARKGEIYAGMCDWAFDLHLQWLPGGGNGAVLQPGSHALNWRLSSLPGSEAQARLSAATFAIPGDLAATWLLYTGGVGNVEHFDKAVPQASPFGEYPWGTGALQDTQVGHTDRTSLRLDGPEWAGTAAGDSQFTESFADGTDYQVSVWVKTDGVTGEGPGIGLSGQGFYPGLTGTSDWQHIGFVVRPSAPLYTVPFLLHNSGGGTAWFDDFLIRKVTAAQPPDSFAGQPQPRSSLSHPQADWTLKWSSSGSLQDRTLLDLSGHGNHGSLQGATWVSGGSGGGRALSFNGRGAHVRMHALPDTDFGEKATLSLWLLPGSAEGQTVSTLISGGTLDASLWLVSLYNQTAPYGLDIRIAGTEIFLQDGVVPAGQWSHLALAHDGARMQVYLNGKLLSDAALPGRWFAQGESGSLRFGTNLVEGQPDSPYAGMMTSYRVRPRALSAAEVAAEFAAGAFGN